MRTEMTGIRKSLTRPAYRNMLWIIGRSNEPLSSTDIISQFGSKYGYEMLKEICPTEYSRGEFLFNWEEVIANSDNGRYKRKLIQRLNNIFSIKWYTGEQQDDLNNKNIVRFGLEKANDGSEALMLYQNDNNIIVIQLDCKNNKYEHNNARIALMTIFHRTRDPLQDGDTESYRLIVEYDKKSNKTRLYTLSHDLATIRYLDVTLKPITEKLISDKRKQVIDAQLELRKQSGDYSNPKISDVGLAEYFPDIADMRNNRENWRYSLNLRGLLLYLFSWSQSTDNRQRIHKIRDVISNPELIKKIPFLLHWQYFERVGFDIFDLLLTISIEYQNQLHVDAEEDNYLLRRITERFSIELENHFHRVSHNAFYLTKKKIGVEEYDKILEKRNEYRQSIIHLQRQWINKQLKVIDYFDSECRRFNLLKDLHHIIEASSGDYDESSVVPVDKLAQKYNMSNWDALKIIAPNYSKYDRTRPYYVRFKDKEYLVLNLCLVSKSKADRLKSLLLPMKDDRIKFSDASLVLDNNGIPKHCQPDLILELGFDIKWLTAEGEMISYSTGDGYNNAIILKK